MELGFSSMNTPEDPAPDELARALEERGYGSFWVGEHSHIPVRRTTPYPAGGEMPRQYTRMMDPFPSLVAAGAATDALGLGTSVALPLEHDVFVLAKTVATVDRLTGGRLRLGVGVGWNVEELHDHRPVPWSKRYRALAECVGALRALWCDDEAEFHGEFYDFDAVWAFPKPLQQPHPPILCGTGGKLGTRHAVEWADAWLPVDVALGDVAAKLATFRRTAAEAGRDDIPVTLVTFGDPTPDDLRRYRDLGITDVVIGPNRTGWADPATTYPFVDRYAELIPELR